MAGVETSKARQLYLLLARPHRERPAGTTAARCRASRRWPPSMAFRASPFAARSPNSNAKGWSSRRRGAGTFVTRRLRREADRRRHFRRARPSRRHGARDRRAADRIRLSRAAAGGRARAAPRSRASACNIRCACASSTASRSPIWSPMCRSVSASPTPRPISPRVRLLALLERTGVKVERATQDVTATLASPEVAGGARSRGRLAADRPDAHGV